MDGGTCSSQSSPVRRDARALVDDDHPRRVRADAADQPAGRPQPVQQRGGLAQAHRVGCVVAELQRLVDDDALAQRPAQHPGAAQAGDGQDAGGLGAAAALLQQLVGGDEHRQIPVAHAHQQVGAALLGDAGKRAVPRRALVAQHAADDQIRARGDGLQRGQIGVRPVLDDHRIRQGRDHRCPVVRPQLRPPPRRFRVRRPHPAGGAVADQPVPAPDQIGPGHRLRDGILGVHDATRVSPGRDRG